MGDLRVTRMTNKDQAFYPTIGPFLSRRALVAELGGPVWDDDGKVWFVATGPDGEVCGFGAYVEAGSAITFCSAWVAPGSRRRGVYQAILDARLADLPPGQTIRATCTARSLKSFTARGFTVRRSRGQFTDVERQL